MINQPISLKIRAVLSSPFLWMLIALSIVFLFVSVIEPEHIWKASGLSWAGPPSDPIIDFITGPVTTVVALLFIVVCTALFILGELSPGIFYKILLMLIFVLLMSLIDIHHILSLII
ncbi:hypothetical protein B375_0211765 (plasmid) [Xylella fastidiosa 6c]|nr:hypothetical protein B375_0211765 [Xylella fastidiosa 6c]